MSTSSISATADTRQGRDQSSCKRHSEHARLLGHADGQGLFVLDLKHGSGSLRPGHDATADCTFSGPAMEFPLVEVDKPKVPITCSFPARDERITSITAENRSKMRGLSDLECCLTNLLDVV